jgi:hypothetical protein
MSKLIKKSPKGAKPAGKVVAKKVAAKRPARKRIAVKKAVTPDAAPVLSPEAEAAAVKREKQIIVTTSMASFSTRRETYTVRSSHPYFSEIKAALQEKDTGAAYRFYAKRLKEEREVPVGKTRIVGNDIEFDGTKFHEAFAEAYALSRMNGASVAALDLFFSNLSKNPSPISLHAFTSFMAKTRMPITDRGTFLAYKRVNSQYLDHHTRRFDNRPGAVLKMDRGGVDSTQENTCSTGFHVCSHTYLSHFSDGPDLVVEINPRDVVAVPPDYSLSKMRLSQYRVLCTLPYFKEKIASHWQDALGELPFFHTGQTASWDPLTGVEARENIVGFQPADEWAASTSA